MDILNGALEAKIKYFDNDYTIVSPGKFVTCAVSGKPIPIEDLKYWSVEKQEPYFDIEASVKATY